MILAAIFVITVCVAAMAMPAAERAVERDRAAITAALGRVDHVPERASGAGEPGKVDRAAA